MGLPVMPKTRVAAGPTVRITRRRRCVVLAVVLITGGALWFARVLHIANISQELCRAASAGDAGLARKLLEDGADPNAHLQRPGMTFTELLTAPFRKVSGARGDGPTPLCLALEKYAWLDGLGGPQWYTVPTDTRRDPIPIIKLLLKYGADPNAPNPFNDTPLLVACEEDSEAATVLLEHGADPSTKDARGYTPLLLSAFHRNPDIMAAMLRHKVRVNEFDQSGFNPLMYGVAHGDSAMLRILLAHGADPLVKNSKGISALSYALRLGNRERQVALLRKRSP
jgi:uncharacterized protein